MSLPPDRDGSTPNPDNPAEQTHLNSGFHTPPPQAAPYPPTGSPATPTNGLAIAALVCALVGIGTWVTAPIGAILGHVARRRIRETGEHGDGMARAGIIVGWLITALPIGCCLLSLGLGLLSESAS